MRRYKLVLLTYEILKSMRSFNMYHLFNVFIFYVFFFLCHSDTAFKIFFQGGIPFGLQLSDVFCPTKTSMCFRMSFVCYGCYQDVFETFSIFRISDFSRRIYFVCGIDVLYKLYSSLKVQLLNVFCMLWMF